MFCTYHDRKFGEHEEVYTILHNDIRITKNILPQTENKLPMLAIIPIIQCPTTSPSRQHITETDRKFYLKSWVASSAKRLTTPHVHVFDIIILHYLFLLHESKISQMLVYLLGARHASMRYTPRQLLVFSVSLPNLYHLPTSP